jgi:hypothetical protein
MLCRLRWGLIEQHLPNPLAKALALDLTARMDRPEGIGQGGGVPGRAGKVFCNRINCAMDGALARGVQY